MKNILKNVSELLNGKSDTARLAPATRQYFFRYER
jgi:hypothetical protein